MAPSSKSSVFIAEGAGVDLSGFPRHTVQLRGKAASMEVFTVVDMPALASRLGAPPR